MILGVTGTQELVIPLGARLGHPIWKKALEDSGINGEKKKKSFKEYRAIMSNGRRTHFPAFLAMLLPAELPTA